MPQILRLNEFYINGMTLSEDLSASFVWFERQKRLKICLIFLFGFNLRFEQFTIYFLLSSKWNSNKHQIGKTILSNLFMALNIPSAENLKRENKPFEKIEGICWVPSWSSYNLHFALSYHVRSDDIFIVAYPRSGTTWMQNIVYKLQTGTQPFDANI